MIADSSRKKACHLYLSLGPSRVDPNWYRLKSSHKILQPAVIKIVESFVFMLGSERTRGPVRSLDFCLGPRQEGVNESRARRDRPQSGQPLLATLNMEVPCRISFGKKKEFSLPKIIGRSPRGHGGQGRPCDFPRAALRHGESQDRNPGLPRAAGTRKERGRRPAVHKVGNGLEFMTIDVKL